MSSPETEQTNRGEPQGILLTGEGALALDEQQRELLRQVASQMAGGLSVEAVLTRGSYLVCEPEPQSHLLTEKDFESCDRLIDSGLSCHYSPGDIWSYVYWTFEHGVDRSKYPEAPLAYLPKGDSMALDIRSVQRRLAVSEYAADAWFRGGENEEIVPFLRLLTDMHLPGDAEESSQA